MDYIEYYLDVAKSVAKRSKCISLRVGCVLVRDDQILSTGINGTPKSFCNCSDHFKDKSIDFIKENHHSWSNKYEIHAEMNAMLRNKSGSVAGAVAYCTHSPCFNCTKHLIAAGVSEIYYTTRYHRLTDEDLADILSYTNLNNVKYIGVPDDL